MKKTASIIGAAALAALSFAATGAEARPQHHNGGGLSVTIGKGGVDFHVGKDRRGRYHRDGRRAHLAKERRDVRQARRALRREERHLARARASGRRGWIRAERRDVRQARVRLRRELRDL